MKVLPIRVIGAPKALEIRRKRPSLQMAPHLDELCGVILSLISYDPNFYDSGDAQDLTLPTCLEHMLKIAKVHFNTCIHMICLISSWSVCKQPHSTREVREAKEKGVFTMCGFQHYIVIYRWISVDTSVAWSGPMSEVYNNAILLACFPLTQLLHTSNPRHTVNIPIPPKKNMFWHCGEGGQDKHNRNICAQIKSGLVVLYSGSGCSKNSFSRL